MKKRDVKAAINMANRLYGKLTETICAGCNGDNGCKFTEEICLDVDTVINTLEKLFNGMEGKK